MSNTIVCPEFVDGYNKACGWLWHELIGAECPPRRFLINQGHRHIPAAVKVFMDSTTIKPVVQYVTRRGTVVRFQTENMLVDYLTALREKGAV